MNISTLLIAAVARLAIPEVTTLPIAPTDPVLAGHGPCRSFALAPDSNGTLYVHATSSAMDPFLRVEKDAADRALLAEDDSSGGGNTPWIKLDVLAGESLVITAAAAAPGAVGPCDVHTFLAMETPATLAAAKNAESASAELEALKEKKDFDAARKLLAGAIEALISTPGSSLSPAITARLQPLSIEAYHAGNLRTSSQALEAILGFSGRALSPDHSELQAVRGNLAVLRKMSGDLPGARALEEQILDTCGRTLPPDHPLLQKVRGNLAVTLKDLGDLSGALALEKAAIEVLERTGQEPGLLVSVKSNLGVTFYSQGNLPAARTLQEEALAARLKTDADDSPGVTKERDNLSLTLRELGDLQGARALGEKVLETQSAKLPDDHPSLQSARGNFALTLAALGELEAAKKLEEKVLEVRSKVLPPDHPHLQNARTNLALTLCDLGKLAEARALQELVVETRSRTLPPGHPRWIAAKGNLALTLDAMGDLASAKALLAEVHEASVRVLPVDSPDLERARTSYAWTLARTGERDRLREVLGEICQGAIARLDLLDVALSPRETEAAAIAAEPAVGTALSLTTGAGTMEPFPELNGKAFALVERLRAVHILGSLLLRADDATGEARRSLDELHRTALDATAEISRLSQGEGSSATGARDSIVDAVRRRDEAYRALRALIASLPGNESCRPDVDPDGISSTLSPGEAAVSFRRYLRVEIDSTTRATREPVAYYTAFVLRKGQPLVRLELGPASVIEKAIEAWRTAEAVDSPESRGIDLVTSSARRVDGAGERLRKLVLDPVRGAAGGANRYVLSLDDALHLVPFDALPEDDGRLAGDGLEVSLRSTLKELTLKLRFPSVRPTLLALGGIDFGAEEAAPSQPSLLAAIVRGAPVGQGPAGGGKRFLPLPATGAEVDEIAVLFRNAMSDGAVEVLKEGRASRDAFEQRAPGARWIHIATHGYFAPDSIPSRADGPALDRRTGLGSRAGLSAKVRGFAPMTLSGLALAGANQASTASGRAPGIVTAEEIAALDLRGCELAVLSACDTGVGVRRAGQGVASLSQALRAAGARCVLASLWKVPDAPTRHLMSIFYRKVWVEKLPASRALWEAKRELRGRRDQKDQPAYSVRDWAGWVLTGDVR